MTWLSGALFARVSDNCFSAWNLIEEAGSLLGGRIGSLVAILLGTPLGLLGVLYDAIARRMIRGEMEAALPGFVQNARAPSDHYWDYLAESDTVRLLREDGTTVGDLIWRHSLGFAVWDFESEFLDLNGMTYSSSVTSASQVEFELVLTEFLHVHGFFESDDCCQCDNCRQNRREKNGIENGIIYDGEE